MYMYFIIYSSVVYTQVCAMAHNSKKSQHSTIVLSSWAGECWSAPANRQAVYTEQTTEPTEPATELQDEPNDLHEP